MLAHKARYVREHQISGLDLFFRFAPAQLFLLVACTEGGFAAQLGVLLSGSALVLIFVAGAADFDVECTGPADNIEVELHHNLDLPIVHSVILRINHLATLSHHPGKVCYHSRDASRPLQTFVHGDTGALLSWAILSHREIVVQVVNETARQGRRWNRRRETKCD